MQLILLSFKVNRTEEKQRRRRMRRRRNKKKLLIALILLDTCNTITTTALRLM